METGRGHGDEKRRDTHDGAVCLRVHDEGDDKTVETQDFGENEDKDLDDLYKPSH